MRAGLRPHTTVTLQVTDPTTGTAVATYPPLTSAEAQQAIAAADSVQAGWRARPTTDRAEPLYALASLMRAGSEGHARRIMTEMGKPLPEALAEVEKCARVCEYYAEHGPTFLADEEVPTEATRSLVSYQPLGLVLAIMPWNFPYWQVIRFAAPALLAGNGVLLKHSPNVTGCALALEALFLEAGFPKGLMRALLVEVPAVKGVIRDPRVQAVTFTGSTRGGREVAALAGSAIKKTVLELGGSDPYVVLEDADVERAAEACVASRLINAGQSCVAAKRLIVVEAVRPEFEQSVVRGMAAAVMGDPSIPGTTLGPLARSDLRETLHRQVTESIDAGAACLLGGEVPVGPGFFYPATVLTDVRPGMPAYSEEVFGPVACILPVKDEAKAIQAANDTTYGLGAAVFTKDLARGAHIAAHEIHAGSCFVNAFVKSDPRLPFGGVRESGYGRELSPLGIREFANAKTIWIA